MLAVRYRRISKQVPRKLKGLPDEPERFEDLKFWSFFVFNFLAGIGYVISMIDFWLNAYIRKVKSSNFITWLKISSTYGCRVAAIIAGVILLTGVVRIKKFFEERKAMDFINSGMLLRHAIAFILYLLGATASAVCLMFVNLYPGNETIYDIFSAVYIADLMAQWVSELLLCEIFWTIGKDLSKVKQAQEKAEDPETLETQEEDDAQEEEE